MALNKVNVPVQLGQTIDTKKDPKQMQGALLVMENANVTRTGEIRKRNGFTSLGASVLGGTDISSGLKLLNYNDELALLNRTSLYTYSDSSNTWSNKGPCPTTSITTKSIVSNSYEQSNQDMCYSNNTSTYAWEDTRGGIRALVIDQPSGSRILVDAELNDTAVRPRCFAIGQYHYVFYINTTSGDLVCRRLDTAEPTSFTTENVITTAISTSTPIFDVCQVGSAKMVVAFRNASDQLEILYVMPSGVVGGLADAVPVPTAITAHDPDGCITVSTGLRVDNKETFHVSWFDTAVGVRTMGFYEDFTTYKAVVTVDATTSPVTRNITQVIYVNETFGSTKLDIFYEVDAAADINHLVKKGVLSLDTNTATTEVFQRAAGLASKAYRYASASRISVSYSSAEGFQDTYFNLSDTGLLQDQGWGFNWGNDWGDVVKIPLIQAKMLPTVAGGHTARASQVPGIWFLDETTVTSAALRKTRVVASNVETFTLKGINQLIINHSSPAVGTAAQLGQNLHIPGGFLKMYDGESVVEHGFHLFPESVTLAEASTGSVGNGTYQYVVVWEWIDAKGQIHRSAPSVPKSVTVSGGPKRVNVTIPTLRYTLKRLPVRSEVVASVYRTTNGGTLFYKVSSDASPLYNDPDADTVLFADTLADASITTKPLLYTTGGVLENSTTPSCNLVVTWKNRLFAAGLEDPTQIAYTKEFVQGEGVQFSDFLTLGADSGGGAITSLAVLDDKLVIFKNNSIFILTGDGPTDSGAQNDFRAPQQIATDVGCTEPESVVLMPSGLMFKSEKGIYLLDRGMSTSYVGDRVQDYNSLDVSSAVQVAEVNQIRFTTEEGTTLVYDYYYDSWSVYTTQTATSAANWLGTYVYLSPDGKVKQEVEGSYSDDGAVIRTTIETSWISVGGLMGFQRLYRLQILGSYVGEHNLTATLSYDFKDGIQDQFSINPSSRILGDVYGEDSPYGSESTYGSNDGVYTFEIKPSIQKCTSFKLKLQDTFPSSDATGGFTISGVTAVIGVKSGLNKLPSARTMT